MNLRLCLEGRILLVAAFCLLLVAGVLKFIWDSVSWARLELKERRRRDIRRELTEFMERDDEQEFDA